MTIYTVAFPIAFSIIAAVLLWFIIGSKGKWALKAFAIIMTMTISIVLWASLSDLEGWATSNSIPEKFQLISFAITEPDKKTTKVGEIYIWVIGEDAPSTFSLAGKRSGQPRSYNLPYSRKLHEQLAEAGERMKKGHSVAGKAMMKQRGDQEGHSGIGQKQDFMFYDLPPAKLPQKISQTETAP
jgi:hypothetical protein